jgi:ABC-type multidrug transport system fused ATPase/permease subunit
MFVPLNFLGSVYSSIVQSLVDVKNLSQLLTESIDVVDVEGATPLPLPDSIGYYSSSSRRGGVDSTSCPSCNKPVVAESWQFCPFCGVDMTIKALASLNPMSNNSSLKETLNQGVVVEFKNVSFSYAGQTAAKGLKDVSFRVEAGTTTAIVGHTGAGKTSKSFL